MSVAPLLLCLCLSLGDPPRDRWFSEDKLKHFVASFVITSLSASGARAAGLDTGTSVWVGAGVGTGLGAWKEIRDSRLPNASVSARDLVWDLAGVAAASALISQAR